MSCPLILDEFTQLKEKLSRQRIWQLRKRKHGLCIVCGEPQAINGFCLDHAIKRRETRRKKHGCDKRYNSITYRLQMLKEAKKSQEKHLTASGRVVG